MNVDDPDVVGDDVVGDYVDALLVATDATCVHEAIDPVASAGPRAGSGATVEPGPAPIATPPAAAPAAPARPAATPERATPEAGSGRWLRVAVGPDRYALALLHVQEVARPAPVVPLRGASAAVLGVMNLRGRVVPVLDLGLWLGGPAVLVDDASRIVVVERDDELLGLLVTAVQDVAVLARANIEPPLIGTDPGPILGVARTGEGPPTVLFDAHALYAPMAAQVGGVPAVKGVDPSCTVPSP